MLGGRHIWKVLQCKVAYTPQSLKSGHLSSYPTQQLLTHQFLSRHSSEAHRQVCMADLITLHILFFAVK